MSCVETIKCLIKGFPLQPLIPISSRNVQWLYKCISQDYHAAIEVYHAVAWVQLPTLSGLLPVISMDCTLLFSLKTEWMLIMLPILFFLLFFTRLYKCSRPSGKCHGLITHDAVSQTNVKCHHWPYWLLSQLKSPGIAGVSLSIKSTAGEEWFNYVGSIRVPC